MDPRVSPKPHVRYDFSTNGSIFRKSCTSIYFRLPSAVAVASIFSVAMIKTIYLCISVHRNNDKGLGSCLLIVVVCCLMGLPWRGGSFTRSHSLFSIGFVRDPFPNIQTSRQYRQPDFPRPCQQARHAANSTTYR